MEIPQDEPIRLQAWTRKDHLRRTLLLAGCLLQAALSLGRWGYLLEDEGDWKSISIGIYWLLPLLLPSSRWHFPLTLILLPTSLLPKLNPFRPLQLLSIALFFLAGSSPRAPASHLPSATSDDNNTPVDEDEDVEALEGKDALVAVGGGESSSVFGWAFFQWPLPLLRLSGSLAILQPHHLPPLPRLLRSRTIISHRRVQAMFGKLLGTRRSNSDTEEEEEGWKTLLKEVWKVNRWNIAVLILLSVIKAFLTFLPAYLLSKLIRSLEESQSHSSPRLPSTLALVIPSSLSTSPYLDISFIPTTTSPLYYCVALALATASSGVLNSHLAYWDLSRVSEPIKVQLRVLLFKKTLRRKEGEGGGGGKSQVLNLFTVDVARIAGFGSDGAGVIVALVDLILGTSLLLTLLGPSALLGVFLNLLLLPANKLLANVTFDVDSRRSAARDARVALVDEVLLGIRGVKFDAAEDYWEEKIGERRGLEVRLQRARYWIGTGYNLIWGSLPILSLLLTFITFTKLQHGILTPSIAFPSLAIFNSLTQVWTILPGTYIKLAEGAVSLQRIAAYLAGSEIDPPLPSSTPPPSSTDDSKPTDSTSFGYRSATVSYPTQLPPSFTADSSPSSTNTQLFSLQNLTVEIPRGELTLICGKVGAGKSLFLLGLLGESDLEEGGEVVFPRSVDAGGGRVVIAEGEEWLIEGSSFVPQTPWLQHASIRSQILFGLPFDRQRYSEVLDCCCLLPDLALFEDGDLCEVGERGVTLSGGQKARVGLARSVYSRARHLVLDDCWSAVDAHTAQRLFENCLRGPLTKGRTVVLVTHHVSLCLDGAAKVIALDNGHLLFSGDPQSFASSLFYTGLARENSALAEEEILDVALEDLLPSSTVADSSLPTPSKSSPQHLAAKRKSLKLILEETRQEGSISFGTYKGFLAACGGPWYWIFFAVAYLGTQALDLLTAWWLRNWTRATGEERRGGARGLDFYLFVYTAITLTGVVGSAVRWIVLYDGVTSRASVTIHKNLLREVLRAPLRHFETTAHGTLINRFASDMSRIDGFLPDDWARCVMYSLSLLSSLGVVCVVSPVFLVAVIGLAPLFFFVGRSYAKITRDLRRLDSVALSPLFSLWSEVISGGGMAVIRSYGRSSSFLSTMLSRLDDQTCRYFHGFSVFLWLTTSFTVLNSVLVGIAGAILVQTGRDAALAGFALTFALSVSNGMLDLILRYVSLELSMVAVERIKEFSIPRAASLQITAFRPPAAWPSSGDVSVEGLSVRYGPDLPDVLHEVSFTIKAGEHVGVVGPTGSGKSTIAASFFRFVEASAGKIVLDGIDISKIGTKDLRSRLTIIPQDPTILSGTLRSVLDLYDEHSDSEIFAALRAAHLLPPPSSGSTTPGLDGSDPSPTAATNLSIFRSLDTVISAGGSNLSQGQRQLLVLGRSLLRNSKLIILDEATSSIDFETDHLITQTIREAFEFSSMIVVAHRLRTIIDFPKVLYLDGGRVIEFDSPFNLLSDESSRFFALCQKTGELSELKRLAGLDV